ncbi:LysR family transcriptional regulator [Candidimonas nitroreducens]|uniref:LysR family transcriptional regulator n=1 Tax=Candidimonas nitroreducens TaxID=683354 RepID=A0A225MZ78_9BURK|nr:LysR family transcriptional regulator [Candidimonas nitroreducens]OWT65833.1 LysR family transcriptional regulator [Candidimonas nitroreducens]
MIPISLRHFRIFVAIAKSGSFTEAASRLFQTQSALTATIQQFEECVGVKLFDRTTRKVTLTTVGESFLPVAERVLAGFDNAVSDLSAISKGQKGHIRIAALPSLIILFLRPTLASFRKIHPEVTVSITDGSVDKIEKTVLNGDADFGICSRLNNYKELDYTPLLTDEFGVVFPNEHPLAVTSGPLTWASLKKYRHIKLSRDTGIGAFMEDEAETIFGRNFSSGDTVSSTNALYAMLGMDDRISVLPALTAHAHPLSVFKFRRLVEPVMCREVCVVTRPLRTAALCAERLLDALMDSISEYGNFGGVQAVQRDAR